jgi:radical SAM protein with 4Fe4S-binding SPASM domain
MPRDLFDRFLQEAKTHAASVCIGFFGEQMLHKEFEEYVCQLAAHQKHYKTTLFTNWSMSTRQNMKALVRVSNVRISLDAPNSKVFDTMRPGSSILDLDGRPGTGTRYETMMDKLDYWLSLRTRPPTALIYIASSVNQHTTKQFVDKFRPRLRRTDTIVTKCPISYGGVTTDSLMSPNQCIIHRQNRLSVAWDGECTPCNLDVNIALSVGNLNTDDMSTILKSTKMQDVLKQIVAKEGICANCFDSNNHTKTVQYRGQK